MKIKRNGLTLTPINSGYICEDLVTIPQRFEEQFSKESAEAIFSEFIDFIRGNVKQCFATKEETESHPQHELVSLGQQTFDSVVVELQEKVSKMSLFEKAL